MKHTGKRKIRGNGYKHVYGQIAGTSGASWTKGIVAAPAWGKGLSQPWKPAAHQCNQGTSQSKWFAAVPSLQQEVLVRLEAPQNRPVQPSLRRPAALVRAELMGCSHPGDCADDPEGMSSARDGDGHGTEAVTDIRHRTMRIRQRTYQLLQRAEEDQRNQGHVSSAGGVPKLCLGLRAQELEAKLGPVLPPAKPRKGMRWLHGRLDVTTKAAEGVAPVEVTTSRGDHVDDREEHAACPCGSTVVRFEESQPSGQHVPSIATASRSASRSSSFSSSSEEWSSSTSSSSSTPGRVSVSQPSAVRKQVHIAAPTDASPPRRTLRAGTLPALRMSTTPRMSRMVTSHALGGSLGPPNSISTETARAKKNERKMFEGSRRLVINMKQVLVILSMFMDRDVKALRVVAMQMLSRECLELHVPADQVHALFKYCLEATKPRAYGLSSEKQSCEALADMLEVANNEETAAPILHVPGFDAEKKEEEPDLQADMLSPFRGLWRKAMANLGKTPDRIDGS
mmetsp:Transcript_8415/g.19810  ORF Transcript_8415/g.19810 Transcript_8415/m.19810 type:complete len:510 (-) Transcript_8415:221-1750(-)